MDELQDATTAADEEAGLSGLMLFFPSDWKENV